ncbi:MAG TPA: hypothetical protein VHQ87_12150, partial [Rhizobacter sp.]|nr:hypothetical protein [Rhizobacter sp.]
MTAFRRLPLPALLATLLAGCGGAGSDTDLGGSGGGSGSAGTATTAGLTMIDMPTGVGSRTPDGSSLRATNDGVYLSLGDSSLPTIIAKRTVGRGGSAAGWLQSTLPPGPAVWTPSTETQELPNAFGIMWSVDGAGTASRYGYTNMNNGGVQANYLDDLGMRVMVPDGPASTSGREWVLNGATVYRKSTGGTGSTDASARYSPVANVAETYLGDAAAASDGAGTLYAAAGSTLYRING